MDEDFEFSWDFGETTKHIERNEKLSNILVSEALLNTSLHRENNALTSALQEIAKPCPILNPAPNTKTHLFVESTERRQQIAKEALRGK